MAQSHPNSTIVDPYDHLHLVLNPDGSLTRNYEFPTTPADPNHLIPTKDITFNHSNNTWLRIYLPRRPPLDLLPNKLPVIFYFHGGGFIIYSAATSLFHVFCADISAHVPAIVISVGYRLAPEHRLPAAYDDAMEAIQWVKTNWASDDWLKDYADFSNCYLMGTSAGANMAYHIGLRLTPMIHDIEPLKIRGLIMHEPFFGGTRRVPSELSCVNDLLLRPGVTDMMWDLSLPIGADRDHEYCNITVGDGPKVLDEIKSLRWKIMVTGYSGDPLFDRAVEAVQFLRANGLEVVEEMAEGEYHVADLFEPHKAKPLHGVLKIFINN